MMPPTAQRVVLALLAGAPTVAAAQEEAAATLWRVAATTVPLPLALALGSPSAFWNPAQPLGRGRVHGGLEFVQAPPEVGASGLLSAVHVALGTIGHTGLVYGRMRIDDLVRTIDGPEPMPGSIPHDTHTLGLTWTRALGGPTVGLTVAYHAACSLQHGQQIRTQPKTLLKRAGFRVVEPADSHLCCGSAGTYNLMQPEISGQLKVRKVATLEATRPDVIAAGNIGCMTQIGAATDLPIVHTVQLLDWAWGGAKPSGLPEVGRSAPAAMAEA